MITKQLDSLIASLCQWEASAEFLEGKLCLSLCFCAEHFPAVLSHTITALPAWLSLVLCIFLSFPESQIGRNVERCKAEMRGRNKNG